MKALVSLCQQEILRFRSGEIKLEIAMKNIAEKVILCGHFDAQGEKIYPIDIEFYYHEEGSDLSLCKDPVMYHTFDHEEPEKYVQRRLKNPDLKRPDCALPYFAPGTFNPHLSGLDFTFENEDEAYRASFLIRGYLIGCSDGEESKCPTHLYNDMLFMGIPMDGTGIHWIEDSQRKGTIVSCERKNVPSYKKANDGSYVKINGRYQKIEVDSDGCVHAASEREWRFKLQK